VDYEVQAKMSAYWANFAKTWDPNLGGSYIGKFANMSLPIWNPNDKNGTEVVIVFELGNGFGNVPVAALGHVAFVEAYFAGQAKY
jgi:carboxylesterase 2